MIFDALDLIRNRREFSRAADTSIAIGPLGAAGVAVTGITDWSDVDPPARRLGLIHGLLNVGVTAFLQPRLSSSVYPTKCTAMRLPSYRNCHRREHSLPY